MLVIIFFQLPPVAVEIRSLDCEPKNPCRWLGILSTIVCVNARRCVCDARNAFELFLNKIDYSNFERVLYVGYRCFYEFFAPVIGSWSKC